MTRVKHDRREPRLTRSFTALALLAALVLTTGARETGRTKPPPPVPLNFAPIVLHVACGELFNAPCGKVLPRIAARTAPTGLELRPAQSGGVLDTVAAICQGQAAAAIVPADAVAQIAREPACVGRYDVVGRPLYPLYGFLVVRADASVRSLDDLVSDGARRTIAAGAEGSGGQITLGVLLRSNPVWQRGIAVTNDEPSSALEQIADGSIDGLFAMESLDSALLNQLRVSADARGERLYRFIDIRLGSDFAGAADRRCLYRVAALDFGDASPVATVSVDVVMILSRAVREAHARSGPFAPVALASAIDAARAGILAATKSPGDWRPADTSCR